MWRLFLYLAITTALMGKITDAYKKELHFLSHLEITVDQLKNETQKAIQAIQRFVPIGNQFVYGARFPDLNYFYTSPSVKNVLGYEPEYFKSPDDFFGLVHEDDIAFVLKANLKALSLGADLKNIPELGHVFQIDFRIRKKNGEYIRVLRQSGLLTKTNDGKLATTFAIVTDITNIKDSNKVALKMNGPEIPGFCFQVDNPSPKIKFTKQEKSIIEHIISGKKSNEIASELNISKETVYTHRRNMIKKSGMRNSIELIAWVLKNGF
jgi:DNA-binding CsgD family transcriptional regulator